MSGASAALNAVSDGAAASTTPGEPEPQLSAHAKREVDGLFNLFCISRQGRERVSLADAETILLSLGLGLTPADAAELDDSVTREALARLVTRKLRHASAEADLLIAFQLFAGSGDDGAAARADGVDAAELVNVAQLRKILVNLGGDRVLSEAEADAFVSAALATNGMSTPPLNSATHFRYRQFVQYLLAMTLSRDDLR